MNSEHKSHSTRIHPDSCGEIRTIASPDDSVHLTPHCPVAMVALTARTGCTSALADCIHRLYQLNLPQEPRWTANDTLMFAGIRPNSWLVSSDSRADLHQTLSANVGEWAAVSDQSSARVLIIVGGRCARNVLSKLLPIDVHARCFAVGDVAATLAAHTSTIVWRLEDSVEGNAVFELAIARSFVTGFWSTLLAAAAEYGIAQTSSPGHFPG